MQTLSNELFLSIVSRLERFYPLVKLVNSRDQLSKDDLKPFFSSNYIHEILHLQKLYSDSGKLRTCGNPSFVHSLRCLIWSDALKSSSRCSRITLFHDYVEDFAKSLSSYDKFIPTIPEDVFEAVSFLTNKYRVIINSLDFSKGEESLISQLVNLSSNDFLSVPASRLVTSLSDVVGDAKSFFESKSYSFYIQDLVSHVKKTDDDCALLAKFFDRFDNTLTELPAKFDVIIRLYDKNTSLLGASKNYIESSNNPLLKLLFSLLFVRSLNQAQALRYRYSKIINVRGEFYGLQYRKLCEALDLEGHKLAKFSSVSNNFIEDDSVQELIEELKK